MSCCIIQLVGGPSGVRADSRVAGVSACVFARPAFRPSVGGDVAMMNVSQKSKSSSVVCLPARVRYAFCRYFHNVLAVT